MLKLSSNKVNILGTEYTVIFRNIQDDKFAQLNSWEGYTNNMTKQIVIINRKSYGYMESPKDWDAKEKQNLRHEILHAFLAESGLDFCSLPFDGPWAANEEMVDWFAMQSPKIFTVYKKLGLI